MSEAPLSAEAATRVAFRFFELCGAGQYREAAELCAPALAALNREALSWEFEPPPSFEDFRQRRSELSEEEAAGEHAEEVARFLDRAPFLIAGVRSRSDIDAMDDTGLLAAKLEAIDPFSHYRFDYEQAIERYPEYEDQLRKKIQETARGWSFEHVGTLLAENGRAYVLYFPGFEASSISDTYDPNPHHVVLRLFDDGWRITVIPLPHARIVKKRGSSVGVVSEDGEDVYLSLSD